MHTPVAFISHDRGASSRRAAERDSQLTAARQARRAERADRRRTRSAGR